MSTPMMKCGHAANAKDKDGKHVCVICIGINPGATEVTTETIDLTGRTARCSYYGGKCRSEKPSSPDLPFFEHNLAATYDSYYCGCYGWD